MTHKINEFRRAEEFGNDQHVCVKRFGLDTGKSWLFCSEDSKAGDL